MKAFGKIVNMHFQSLPDGCYYIDNYAADKELKKLGHQTVIKPLTAAWRNPWPVSRGIDILQRSFFLVVNVIQCVYCIYIIITYYYNCILSYKLYTIIYIVYYYTVDHML